MIHFTQIFTTTITIPFLSVPPFTQPMVSGIPDLTQWFTQDHSVGTWVSGSACPGIHSGDGILLGMVTIHFGPGTTLGTGVLPITVAGIRPGIGTTAGATGAAAGAAAGATITGMASTMAI